jgi:hypothetical protein
MLAHGKSRPRQQQGIFEFRASRRHLVLVSGFWQAKVRNNFMDNYTRQSIKWWWSVLCGVLVFCAGYAIRFETEEWNKTLEEVRTGASAVHVHHWGMWEQPTSDLFQHEFFQFRACTTCGLSERREVITEKQHEQ